MEDKILVFTAEDKNSAEIITETLRAQAIKPIIYDAANNVFSDRFSFEGIKDSNRIFQIYVPRDAQKAAMDVLVCMGFSSAYVDKVTEADEPKESDNTEFTSDNFTPQISDLPEEQRPLFSETTLYQEIEPKDPKAFGPKKLITIILWITAIVFLIITLKNVCVTFF